jgi:3-hydroxymyristoyl/3-hydroxydecanoyl-(acyl carrier protein) dehydratase
VSAELLFGAEVVRMLIPQRPPLLLVDRALAFDRARPSLRCDKLISANEPVFAGHFPDLALWPGAYTIEGLGQAANLLEALSALTRACEEQGQDPDALIDALRDLHAAHRLSNKPLRSHPILEGYRGPSRVAMSAAIDVKLLEPVFAGQRLEYSVARTHSIGDAGRFAVEAWVDGRPVARGSITGSARFTLPLRAGA